MLFQQFITPDGDLSYALACAITGEAALIDPDRLALDQYQAFLAERGLELRYLLETHVHESHQSASPVLRQMTAAQLVAGETAAMDCVEQRVRSGDVLYVGEETIQVIATPGHSACSLVYRWRDRVFTGHTLLAGATGHCVRADSDAQQLFNSIRDVLYCLPGETLVFPGKTCNGRRVSTLDEERKMNLELNDETERQQFIAAKKDDHSLSSFMSRLLAANRKCQLEQILEPFNLNTGKGL